MTERWIIDPDVRSELAKEAAHLMSTAISKKIRLSAARVLIAADRLNLEQQKLDLEREIADRVKALEDLIREGGTAQPTESTGEDRSGGQAEPSPDAQVSP